MKRRQSIIFYWMVSYIAILSITILIMSAVYASALDAVTKEILHSNELVLINVQEMLDNKLLNIRRIADKMELESRITRNRSVYGTFHDADPYVLYEAYNQIRSYMLNVPYVSECLVYYHNTDTIVSNQTAADSHYYYNAYVKETGMAYEDWMQSLTSDSSGFRGMAYRPGSDAPADRICFVKTFPAGGQGPNPISVMFLLDTAQFIGGTDINGRNFYISDAASQQVYPSSNIYPPNQRAALPDTPSNGISLMDYREGGIHSVISYVSSNISGLKYAVFTPRSVFYQRSFSVLRVAVFGVVLCAVLGAAVIMLSIRLNYNPVKRLIQDLEKQSNRLFHKHNNEFTFFADVLESIGKNRELETSAFRRIIQGGPTPEQPPADILKLYGVSPSFTCYAVFLLQIQPGELPPEGDLFEYASLALSSMVKKSFTYENAPEVFFFSLQGLKIGVAGWDSGQSEEAVRDDVIRTIAQISHEVEQQFYIKVKYVVGRRWDDIGDLWHAFHDAAQDWEQPEGKPVYPMYDYPKDKKKLLANLAGVCDREKTFQLLQDLFDANRDAGENMAFHPGFHFFTLGLIQSAVEIAREHDVEDAFFLEASSLIHSIPDACHYTVIEKNVTAFYSCLMDCLQRGQVIQQERQYQELVRKIAQYVQENYSNANLSVAAIADQFGLNSVQMSRAFREQMPDSLPDYINKIRLENAKQMIISKRYSNLDEISVAAGYNNAKTLTRAFKRYEGITPGQYREMHGQKAGGIRDGQRQ